MTVVGRGLRGWALTSTAAGTAALGLSGLLPPPVGALGVLGLVLGSAAAHRCAHRPAPPPWLRAGALLAAAAVAGTAAPQVVAGGALAATPSLALALALLQTPLTRTVREVRLLLLLGLVLLLAALGLAPAPALVLPLVLVWVAVLAGLVASAGPAVSPASSSAASPTTSLAALRRPLAVAGVVGLVGFLVVPRPDVDTTAARAALGEALGGSAPTRSAQAYAGGVLDLDARGDLPGTPVLAVPVDSPAYWRAAVLDTYAGHSWTASRSPRWTVSTTDEEDASYRSPTEDGTTDDARRDEVLVLAPYPALVAPGAPTAVGDVEGGGRVLTSPGGTAVPGASGYAVTSRVPASLAEAALPGATTDAATGARAQPADAGATTALPASVPQRVRELGRRLVAGAPDRVAAVRAVEDDLRARALYSLDAPVPAEGADAVDAFLFVDRVGFCEQFASAEVVLLRSAGVPARLVTGFAGGAPVAAGAVGGVGPQQRVLRGRDAHAWVEVWVEGRGWTTSDPTVGSRTVAQAGPWWQRLWLRSQGALARVLASAPGRLAEAGAVLVVVALAVVAAQLRRRRGAARGADLAGGAGARGERERRDVALVPLLAALAAFDAAVAGAGLGRGAAEGLGTWSRRLVAAGWVAAGAAVQVVERACYARVLPAVGERQEAVRALESETVRVLARGPVGITR